MEDIADLRPPAMLLVDHPKAGKEGHAVAYMGMRDGRVEIWDPMEGKRTYEPDELHPFWHGRAISVRREE